MEAGIQRFVRLLRTYGIRVSTSEVIDALVAAAAIGFADRASLKSVLGATLVKERRDWPLYATAFDQYFNLVPAGPTEHPAHDHGHEGLADDGLADRMTLSEELSETAESGHEHGKPADIRDYFDARDLASQYNLHQQADKIDIASMTEHLILSKGDSEAGGRAANRVQIQTSRLRGAGHVKELAPATGTWLDTVLTLAEQQTLLDWLEDDLSSDDAARRQRTGGVIDRLPELLKAQLERLAAQRRRYELDHQGAGLLLQRVSEAERAQMEEALRRLARRMHGALTHRKGVAPSGRVDITRTMRRNLKYEAIPFRPVTVARKEDRPRLVVLADVSLSVRNSARFTLHFVHGLQRTFSRARTFIFVDDVVEVTEQFHDHSLEDALELVFGGRLLDVDANSDYGRTFERFVDEHLSVVTHRTTLLILGDGRGNEHNPGLNAFEQLARRARSVIWLTPEPRYSWRLGRCDLPLYAEWCDRVELVRDLRGLDRVAETMMLVLGHG